MNWSPALGATKDQATGIGGVVGVVFDHLTCQNSLIGLLLQNATKRLIMHFPTGVLSIENPVLSKTVL